MSYPGRKNIFHQEHALELLNRAMHSGLFQVRWVGCDAAYGNDHTFLDSLELPEGVWYFAATNAKAQVFPEYPEMSFPEAEGAVPGSTRYCPGSRYRYWKLHRTRQSHEKRLCWRRGRKGPLWRRGNICAAMPAAETGTGIM